MKTRGVFFGLLLLGVGMISTTNANAECAHSKWLIENRIIDSKLPLTDARITFTCNHYEFGLGVQTIWIIFGKTKKQVKTNVKGMYALSLKPGKYKMEIKQDGCDPLVQPIEVKNRERISIKVTFAKALDPNVKCYNPPANHYKQSEHGYAILNKKRNLLIG